MDLIQNNLPVEEQARAVGDFFANLVRNINNQSEEDVDMLEYGMSQLMGPALATNFIRVKAITDFFTETLNTHSMPETILLTKEHFQLSDDYSIKIPLLVEFKPAVVAKGDEPCLDWGEKKL